MKPTPKKPSKKTVSTPEAQMDEQQGVSSISSSNATATDTVSAKQSAPSTDKTMTSQPQGPTKDTSSENTRNTGDKEKPPSQVATPSPAVKKTSAETIPPHRASSHRLLTVFALLLAGGAVTFSAIMWQQVRQLDQKLQASAGIENNAIQIANAATQQTQLLTNKLDSMQRNLGVLQADLDTLNQGDQRVDQIINILSNPKTEMLALSIRSLLASAELQVALSNNIQPLLTTLTSIDNQLKASGQESDSILRQAILKDIDDIRNHPAANPLNLANNINELIDTINQDNKTLSLRKPEPAAAPDIHFNVDVTLNDSPLSTPSPSDTSTWGGIKNAFYWTIDKTSEVAANAWDQVSDLVKITPIDGEQKINLSNDEAAVLKETIKLRLMGARLTILQGQYEQADKELGDAYRVIETYFDPEKSRSILNRLNELSSKLKNMTFPKPVRTIAALDALESDQ